MSPHSYRMRQFGDDFDVEGDEFDLDLPPLNVHTATTTYQHPASGRVKTRTIYTNHPSPRGTTSLRRHSMYDPSSDSDVDRRQVEALDEAEAVYDRYFPNSHIRHEVSFDRIVHDLCSKERLDYSDPDDRQVGVRMLQHILKERCLNKNLRCAEVYLDTEGEEPNPNRRWMSPTLSKIVFTQITAADTILRRHTDDQRFVAIYWDCDLAPMRYVEDRYTGEQVARRNGFDAAAYVAICGVYPSLPHAEEAAQELQRAVDVIARSRTDSALIPDPVRNTLEPGRSMPTSC